MIEIPHPDFLVSIIGLNMSTSAGPDCTHIASIKPAIYVFSSPLQQKTIQYTEVNSYRSVAIYNKIKKKNVSNYCSDSLTNLFVRLLKKILNNSIDKHPVGE